MSDKNHRAVEPALQIGQQLQDLCLDGHVERRGRLIRDQDVGLAGNRRGNQGTLTHAARKLVRIIVATRFRVRDADQLEQLDRARPRCRAVEALVRAQTLGDLLPDGEDGVERGHRVLEHHADSIAANALHLALAQGQQVLVAIEHAAFHHAARRLHKAEDRLRGHALARA